MKQAILLPYAVEQNEPSVPINKIFSIPDNEQEREAMLFSLFKQHVMDEAEDEGLTLEEGGTYGDLQVSYLDDIFLYVIFIED